MRKDIIILLIFLLLLVPTVSAATLSAGTILNATGGSNSSITIDSPEIQVSEASVENNGVVLKDASWTNGELIINVTSVINWTNLNANILSSAFPRFSSSSITSKTIASGLNQTINATVIFSVGDYSSIGTVVHTRVDGTSTTYGVADYSLTTTRVSMSLINISNGDTITISYNQAQEDICEGALAGLKEFGIWLPIIIIVLIAGVVMMFLFGGGEGILEGLEDNTTMILVAIIAVAIGAVIIAAIAGSGGAC